VGIRIQLQTIGYCIRFFAIDFIRYLQNVWCRAGFRVRGVLIASHVDVRVDALGSLDIGKGVAIGRNTLIVVTSEGQQAVRSTLSIGAGTAINESNNIRASGGTITIGRKCLIAQFVSIIASNHEIDIEGDMMDHPWSLKNNFVTIGDNVWVGAGSIILPGVTIGDGAVIAAGSVVTRSIGENELYAGMAARLLRKRNISATS
jgi:acetyltransferase-like isoleucine patch superfamily enzyme